MKKFDSFCSLSPREPSFFRPLSEITGRIIPPPFFLAHDLASVCLFSRSPACSSVARGRCFATAFCSPPLRCSFPHEQSGAGFSDSSSPFPPVLLFASFRFLIFPPFLLLVIPIGMAIKVLQSSRPYFRRNRISLLTCDHDLFDLGRDTYP